MSGTKPTPGVTITLTGDASDSVVTDANGEFSFGLPDGSYVLTPSKGGHQFTPASANVEVSGADDTGNDFTAEGVYTISGTIVDGEAAGVEGVTVALTGDDTDSTTTAADGTYSFTGVVDGSYTVTPTKTSTSFTPASDSVTISGADDTSDFSGYLFLGFISFDEDTLAGVAGSVSDWVHGANHTVTEVIQAISSDQGSHTPSQATKEVFADARTQTSEFIYPCGTLPRTGKVRVALLARGYDTIYRQWWFGTLTAGDDDPSLDDMFSAFLDLGGDPDIMDAYHRTAGGDILHVSAPTITAGVNNNCRRWVWQRAEFDYDASEISWHSYQPADALTGTVRTVAFPSGFGDNVFTKVYFKHSPHLLYENVAAAGIWMGNGNDAWPTT